MVSQHDIIFNSNIFMKKFTVRMIKKVTEFDSSKIMEMMVSGQCIFTVSLPTV